MDKETLKEKSAEYLARSRELKDKVKDRVADLADKALKAGQGRKADIAAVKNAEAGEGADPAAVKTEPAGCKVKDSLNELTEKVAHNSRKFKEEASDLLRTARKDLDDVRKRAAEIYAERKTDKSEKV